MLAAMWLPVVAAAMAPVADVRALAFGESFGCAVTTAGALNCFGNNGHGELGQGADEGYVKFARPTMAAGVTAVAAGREHACAIVAGALWCWGGNSAGQVGGGMVGGRVGVDVRRPLKIIEGGVTAVSAGLDNTCAVVAGALRCWGRNREGQVGNGIPAEAVGSPLEVIAAGVSAVATGGQHTCAVVEGDLRCWGFLPELSNGMVTPQLQPRTVIAGGVSAVAARQHTCAIVRGALQCWGRNFWGQVGVEGGPAVAPKTPQTIIGQGVTQVVVNDRNTCAIAGGALHCWGDISEQQLGRQAAPFLTPRVVVAGDVSAVAIGMRSVCAVVAGVLQCTNRAPDDKAPPQDWRAFGTVPTPFSTPDPVPPRLAVYGVWRGTLGRQEVMVNLQPEGCEASYYYLRHLWGITLAELDPQSKRWREGGDETGAVWTIESLADGVIEGSWSDAKGERRLPLRLRKIAATANTKAYECSDFAGSAAFDAPRLKAKAPTGSEQRFDGRAYQALGVPGTDIQSAQFPPSPQPLPRLNRTLRQWLDSKVVEYYGCQTATGHLLDAKDPKPDFTAQWAPLLWNDRVLVLHETYSSFCGGAHPNGGTAGYLSWDLATDREVDPWTWLAVRKTPEGTHVLPSKLKALIDRLYAGERGSAEDEECRAAVTREAYFLVHPVAEGMAFTPELPHVVQACADDVVVPWSAIAPFLTPAGRQAVQGLLGVPPAGR